MLFRYNPDEYTANGPDLVTKVLSGTKQNNIIKDISNIRE